MKRLTITFSLLVLLSMLAGCIIILPVGMGPFEGKWREEVLAENNKMRREPSRWKAGKFVHPHDACFDREGNIFVAEWVATGRVSFMKRLS